MLSYGQIMQKHRSESGPSAATPVFYEAGLTRGAKKRSLEGRAGTKSKRKGSTAGRGANSHQAGRSSMAAKKKGKKKTYSGQAMKKGATAKKGAARRGKHPTKADFKAAGGDMKKAWALYHARHGTKKKAAKSGGKKKSKKKKAKKVTSHTKAPRKAAKSTKKKSTKKSPKRKSSKKSHASKSGSKRKGSRKGKGGRRTSLVRRAGSTSVRSDLTVNVRGAMSQPARKGKGKRKGGKRKGGGGKKKGSRAKEHYMAENPLGAGEMILGGFTGVLGFIVGDGVDRFLASHALTDKNSKDASGNELFADSPPTTGSYSGLFNATAIAAPMDLLRWGVGLGVPLVVVLGGRMINNPLGRSGVQMFGFVWGVRTLGKGLTDLIAYMTRSKAFGQRLYDAEMRAASMAAGTNGYPLASLPSTGLGRAGGKCCQNCAKGLPCSGKEQAPAPPAPPSGYAGIPQLAARPAAVAPAPAPAAAPVAAAPANVTHVSFGLYSPRHAQRA